MSRGRGDVARPGRQVQAEVDRLQRYLRILRFLEEFKNSTGCLQRPHSGAGEVGAPGKLGNRKRRSNLLAMGTRTFPTVSWGE